MPQFTSLSCAFNRYSTRVCISAFCSTVTLITCYLFWISDFRDWTCSGDSCAGGAASYIGELAQRFSLNDKILTDGTEWNTQRCWLECNSVSSLEGSRTWTTVVPFWTSLRECAPGWCHKLSWHYNITTVSWHRVNASRKGYTGCDYGFTHCRNLSRCKQKTHYSRQPRCVFWTAE